MAQKSNVEQFIDHYHKVNEFGAESYCIDLQREVEKERLSYIKNPTEADKRDLHTLDKAFESNQKQLAIAESMCSSINLTRGEAIQIINMRDREGSVVDAFGVNGADAYNYMNSAVKNSPIVAKAAMKAQEETSYQGLSVKVDIPSTLDNQICERMAQDPNLSKKDAVIFLADKEQKVIDFMGKSRQEAQKNTKQQSLGM